MAQVQFDRCWVHSTGQKKDRVTSILLYNRPPTGRKARKIQNVRVYRVKDLEEWKWIRNLAKSKVRLRVQVKPHARDSFLVFKCAQWRKEDPMGEGGGSIDDEEGRRFDFGPQDAKMVAICDLLTKNCKKQAFEDAMHLFEELIGIDLTMLCNSCSLDACLQWNFMISIRTYSYIGAVL
jgi:hypothetical protein